MTDRKTIIIVHTWNTDEVSWGPFATLDEALAFALSTGEGGRRFIEVNGQIVFDMDTVIHNAQTAAAHATARA